MTLSDYHTLWEQDAVINQDTLDEHARTVPNLHAKWWRFYASERLKFRKLDIESKSLYKNLLEYYTNKMLDEDREKLGWPPNPRLILSANVDTYIEADPHMIDLATKVAYQEELLRFLESVIGNINRRGYDIKNAIDFLKFKMGV